MSTVVDEVVESHPPRPRRRVGRIVVVAVAVAAVVVGVMVVRQTASGAWPGGFGRWGEDVTRGPLASDTAAVDAALAAWSAGAYSDAYVESEALLEDPIDDARVIWIGDVDGATTAVVRQKIALTSAGYHDDDLEGGETGYVFAFVREDEDGMTVRAVHIDWGSSSPVSPVLGAWLSSDPGLALLLDLGTPLTMSASPAEPATDGGYGHTFEPAVFDADGVAVVHVGTDAIAGGRRLLVGPADGSEQAYGIVGEVSVDAEPVLVWSTEDSPSGSRVVPIEGLADAPRNAAGTFEAWISARVMTETTGSFGTSPWVLAGSDASGELVAISTFQVDGSWRLGLVSGTTGAYDVFDAGQAPSTPEVPVAVRLPGGGWVVGAPGATLSYRARTTQDWIPAGGQAVLLPDADLWQLQVTTGSESLVVKVAAEPATPLSVPAP